VVLASLFSRRCDCTCASRSLPSSRSRFLPFLLALVQAQGAQITVQPAGNLGFDVNNKDLEELFAQAGACESVAVITDRDTGQSRGFGFVEMGSNGEAQRAIQQFDGHEFKGRALKVNEGGECENSRGFGGGSGRDYPQPVRARRMWRARPSSGRMLAHERERVSEDVETCASNSRALWRMGMARKGPRAGVAAARGREARPRERGEASNRSARPLLGRCACRAARSGDQLFTAGSVIEHTIRIGWVPA